jgi:hypothetical protein
LNNKSKSEPVKLFKNTLFGSKENKDLGLLGDLSDKESDKEESDQSVKVAKNKKGEKAKKKPLFQNGETNAFSNSNLFSGGSLFGSSLSKTLASSSLFSGSSFNANSSLFGNQTKKNEDESGDENDDNNEEDILKPSDSPKAYDPINNENKGAVKSIFTKKYLKEIESFYELVKEEVNTCKDSKDKADEAKSEAKEEKNTSFVNKYVNKGKGFLSFEYTEEGGKAAIMVYRY